MRASLDPAAPWSWRTRTGDEIDLVIEAGGRAAPIEIKRSATITPVHLAPLRRFLDAAQPEGGGRGLVIGTMAEVRRLDERILAVPWWALAG